MNLKSKIRNFEWPVDINALLTGLGVLYFHKTLNYIVHDSFFVYNLRGQKYTLRYNEIYEDAGHDNVIIVTGALVCDDGSIGHNWVV
jgi:hypothetical protein